MLCDKRPLPRSHVQKDGLNPLGASSYLVVYQEKLGDFELEFDYKLEKGCNSGVFLRVSDLSDPVRTGSKWPSTTRLAADSRIRGRSSDWSQPR